MLSRYVLTSLLLCTVHAYDVADLDRLQLEISGPGGTQSFDLTLNENARFSAEVQGLDAGATNITLRGYDDEGTPMYDGDWAGTIRSDGKPTQVALYMVDLKPDIDYASLSNVAPFFTAIEVEPSNIAHNESLTIRTRARDLDGSELNYTVLPLDPLLGELTPCAAGSGGTCETTYRSSALDSNGVKSFEVAVTDGTDSDRIAGAFNVRAYGGVDVAVVFNSRPGASSINVGPRNFLTPSNPTLSLEVALFDDTSASWSWSVRGNGTECEASRLMGDVDGSFTTRRDTTATFTALSFDVPSTCVLDLRVADDTAPALEYHLSVPVVVGTESSNAAPHVLYAYATSRHPHSGDKVRYVVRAADDHGLLQAAWSAGGAGVVLHEDAHSNADGFYDFIMEMESSGSGGTVKCTVTDAGGLEHVTTFDVRAPLAGYTVSSTCPVGTERVTDRSECIDAASQLGHTWNENPAHAWAPRLDGGGFCVQCLYCSDSPITYMHEYNGADPFLLHYCKPALHRRLGSVDAVASDAPSPFLFGVDMRIESGTLYVTSNEVPTQAALTQPEANDSDFSYYALGGSLAGVAALAAVAVKQKQRSSKQLGLEDVSVVV